MELQEVMVHCLREINKEMKPDFFIDHPFLLRAQFSYCASKFNEDSSYEISMAVSNASHVFSLLTYCEQTLDYMIRRRQTIKSTHANEAAIFDMIMTFVMHFYQHVDSVLEAQHYVYYHLLLVFMQTANVMQKVDQR